MKYAVADYGMNVWDGGFFDLEERLLNLKKIGFNGIERLEAVDSFDAIRKAAIFHRLGMDFITCRGAKIEQNIEWTSAFNKDYIWLTLNDQSRKLDIDKYCRQTNILVNVCKKYNIKVALHNHLGIRIENQDELDYFMEKCPEAFLLLDVGHLVGAGGDVCGAVNKYFDRIVAVHFKDVFITDASQNLENWTKRLRFCELGAGNINFDFEAVAGLLKKKNYDKWTLVEHDTHLREPLIDLEISINHLKKVMD